MTRYELAPAVAARLGIRTSTLARWRRSKPPVGPQGWVRYNATSVAYPVEEIDRWIAQRQQAAPQAGPQRAA